MKKVKSEEAPVYGANHEPRAETAEDLEILKRAHEIIARRFERGETISSPDDSKLYLIHHFNGGIRAQEHETFVAVWLDNRHRIIAIDELFKGTIDGASVYPREVVKTALSHNAAAVIFSHNHPSGIPEPSTADNNITDRLKSALSLVDVRVLDHIIIGGTDTVSFAERGLI